MNSFRLTAVGQLARNPELSITGEITFARFCLVGDDEVSDGEDTLQFSPNRYVDIAENEAQKRAACFAHASQTPDRYYALQDDVARFRGLESG